MVASDDSTSMLCARVVRGISSIAKNDTPAAARSDASRTAVSGSPSPITIWPGAQEAKIGAAGFGIRAQTAELDQDVGFGENLFAAGRCVAPLAMY